MSRARARLGVVVAAVAALFVVAGPVGAADKGVSIAGFAFNPQTITVKAGDTVTWTNNDSATHTATGAGFDTGQLGGGASGSVTFSTAGTFAYHCSIHSSMTGTVIVEAASNGNDGQATTPPTDTLAAVSPSGRDDTRDLTGLGGLVAMALAGLFGGIAISQRLAGRRAD